MSFIGVKGLNHVSIPKSRVDSVAVISYVTVRIEQPVMVSPLPVEETPVQSSVKTVLTPAAM